jgi:hypothetical protein
MVNIFYELIIIITIRQQIIDIILNKKIVNKHDGINRTTLTIKI